ncbi:MAG: ubiquitin family protein [Ruminococcus sp.]|nr:ubiquitin family protein [Ruminococcus sp.]
MNLITVEVICPSTSRKYDYRLPVRMKAGDIKKQMVEDIRIYEGISSLFEEADSVNLYCERCMLDDEATPEEAGVKNGDRLMIV